MEHKNHRYYRLYAEMAEEYVQPGEELKVLERGCERSEFQFLTHQPLEIPLAETGGYEFPDFLNVWQIPLVSDDFKAVLDEAGVNNLFYKVVTLQDAALGRKRYWLALPPRIRCLNCRESQFVNADSVLPKATKIVINPSKTGNYQIFRIAEVVNRDLIVTEELKEKLMAANLENIYFEMLEG